MPVLLSLILRNQKFFAELENVVKHEIAVLYSEPVPSLYGRVKVKF
jgi:hypothetical protein